MFLNFVVIDVAIWRVGVTIHLHVLVFVDLTKTSLIFNIPMLLISIFSKLDLQYICYIIFKKIQNKTSQKNIYILTYKKKTD